ncbi:hypothetical protein LL273_09295 [Marinobacter salarius]|uniref:hypothetical protein n=1 Tax=Marinobacter salarius TaxID=1420917 RepID=UPI001D1863C7|nr:hypothetical protein [Marinobacter salarius]MCC4283921.1 hypothetical protein [Marinobacter salarius]
MLKLLLAILVLPLLGGCISSPDYPRNWAAISDDNVCSKIIGRYSNIGLHDSGHKIGLVALLFPSSASKADVVEILMDENVLRVEAFNEGVLVKKYAEKIDLASCEKASVSIDEPEPEGGINREGVVGIGWGSFRLSASDDGDLIVHQNSSGAGIVLFLPFAGSSWSWSKFSQIE